MSCVTHEDFWNDAWNSKINFSSSAETKSLPWDIKTYDVNLKNVLNFLNLDKGNLFEIGCGSGYDTNYLIHRGFNVTAIDIAENAINIAKEVNKKLNVELKVADFFSFVTEKKYDVVYDRGFLHNHLDKIYEIFQKIYFMLSDNGYYIFITGNPNQHETKTARPPIVFLSQVEESSFSWFKIVLAQEIIFKLDKKYEDVLGYVFVLKKKHKFT